MHSFRRWLKRWGFLVGPTLIFLVGVGLFAGRGLYSIWGPVGALLAAVVVIMAVKDVRGRNRKRR